MRETVVTKGTAEKLFLSCLLLLCAAYTVIAFDLKVGSMREPGPGYLPIILGMLATIIAGMLLVKAYRHRNEEAITDFTRAGVTRLIVYIVTLVLSSVLFTTLGPVALFSLLLILAKISGFKRWGYPFLLAAIFTVTCYTVFEYLLLTPLPWGIIQKVW